MDDDELDAIEQRANAATLGPWTIRGCGVEEQVIDSPADRAMMGNATYYPWTPERDV